MQHRRTSASLFVFFFCFCFFVVPNYPCSQFFGRSTECNKGGGESPTDSSLRVYSREIFSQWCYSPGESEVMRFRGPLAGRKDMTKEWSLFPRVLYTYTHQNSKLLAHILHSRASRAGWAVHEDELYGFSFQELQVLVPGCGLWYPQCILSPRNWKFRMRREGSLNSNGSCKVIGENWVEQFLRTGINRECNRRMLVKINETVLCSFCAYYI